MDLHSIVSGCIGEVNPNIPVVVQFSTGYSTGNDGSQSPSYSAPVRMSAQMQPISTDQLKQTEGINLGGVTRTFYLRGEVDAIMRVSRKGGDIITLLPAGTSLDNTVWLTVASTEQWPDWCAVVATLQNGK